MRPFKLYGVPPVTVEVKYGGKKKIAGGKTIPYKLDHFNVVSRERGDLNFNPINEVNQALAENGRPVEIPIRLLSDDPYESFPLFRGVFDNAGKLWCGAPYKEKKAQRQFVMEKGAFKECDRYDVDCNAECEFWKNKKCDIGGILYFRIPKEPIVGSLACLRVNSTYSQRRIVASLEMIAKTTFGVLANLPLVLKLHKENKKAQDGKIYPIPMISVELGPGFEGGLAKELKRRKEMMELGIGEMRIVGALEDMTSRKEIEAFVDEPFLDDSFTEMDEPQEGYDYPDEVHDLLDGLPEKKAEILVNQFKDDVEGLKAHLLKDKKDLDEFI